MALDSPRIARIIPLFYDEAVRSDAAIVDG